MSNNRKLKIEQGLFSCMCLGLLWIVSRLHNIVPFGLQWVQKQHEVAVNI